jgi:xanthine dehydrogenase accessory factor
MVILTIINTGGFKIMHIDSKKNVYIDLLNTLESGKKAVMVTTLNNNTLLHSNLLLTEEDLLLNNELNLDENLFNSAKYALEYGNIKLADDIDTGISLIEPNFPEPKLIVFGGGHIAKPLVEFASKVGFKITVIDDRPTFANSIRFPEAEKVICENFENCFNHISLNGSSFVVIITRGHRHDMDCLKQTLKHEVAYVGMIGSKRRVKIVKEQLLNEGYPEECIDKINAPIGLDINAVSPEEIAISIIAQLISYRRGKKITTGSSSPQKVNYPEFDPIVIKELAKNTDENKALVTIVFTKGSVPRKSGAKMIVFGDGRTLGSIGGGCSEGEVITIARDIIKNGGYKIHDVDMTGYIAEEEGMVCGGVMKVLIQSIHP